MKKWLHSPDGFVSYEVYENDRNWADRIVWRDAESAQRINKAFMESEIAWKMLTLVESDYRGILGKSVDVYENA